MDEYFVGFPVFDDHWSLTSVDWSDDGHLTFVKNLLKCTEFAFDL